jgi:hypothetical protein
VDAFIAERHDYLEKAGLLQKLDEEAPVTTVATNAAPVFSEPTPPAPLNPSAVNFVSDIKVEAPKTVPNVNNPKTIAALDAFSKNPVQLAAFFGGVGVGGSSHYFTGYAVHSLWSLFVKQNGWFFNVFMAYLVFDKH